MSGDEVELDETSAEPTTPPFPMTIVSARHGSHKWLALPVAPWLVPKDPLQSDMSKYMNWLKTARAQLVGRGVTPTDAVIDMVQRLERRELKVWRDEEGWP